MYIYVCVYGLGALSRCGCVRGVNIHIYIYKCIDGYISIYTIYCNILSTLDILGTNMEVTWEFMNYFSQNLYTQWVIWKCGI